MRTFDLQAERALLGCLMLDVELLERLQGFRAEWMSPANREVFEEIKAIYADSIPLTLVVLCQRLSSRGRLEHAGGAGNISSMMDGVAGTVSEVEECSNAIMDKNRKGELRMIAQHIVDCCDKSLDKASHIASSARSMIENLREAPERVQDVFIEAPKFLNSRPPDISWYVKGLIEQGANGFIAGPPKSGKSWLAADLAIAMSSGNSWLGMETAKQKVALISREDAPGLTAWRIRSLCMGRGIMPDSLSGLWVNSKAQSPYFRLDRDDLVDSMILAIKKHGCRFAILDVMNVLHGADENDASQMRKVMDSLTRIHVETGAGLCVLHHFNKTDSGSITQRLRGSSAIAGWAEYIIAVEPGEVRKASFELKAACSPDPLSVFIESEGHISFLRHDIWRPPETSGSRKRIM